MNDIVSLATLSERLICSSERLSRALREAQEDVYEVQALMRNLKSPIEKPLNGVYPTPDSTPFKSVTEVVLYEPVAARSDVSQGTRVDGGDTANSTFSPGSPNLAHWQENKIRDTSTETMGRRDQPEPCLTRPFVDGGAELESHGRNTPQSEQVSDSTRGYQIYGFNRDSQDNDDGQSPEPSNGKIPHLARKGSPYSTPIDPRLTALSGHSSPKIGPNYMIPAKPPTQVFGAPRFTQGTSPAAPPAPAVHSPPSARSNAQTGPSAAKRPRFEGQNARLQTARSDYGLHEVWMGLQLLHVDLGRDIQTPSALWQQFKIGTPENPCVEWLDKTYTRKGWVPNGADRRFLQRRQRLVRHMEQQMARGNPHDKVLAEADKLAVKLGSLSKLCASV